MLHFNTVLAPSPLLEKAHYLFAAIFLGCLAYMSIFIFTKSDRKKENQTERKRLRNKIYRTCGVLMIVAMIIIAINPGDMDNLVFWLEALAVELFGFSWLVKGEALFRDKRPILRHCKFNLKHHLKVYNKLNPRFFVHSLYQS